IDPGVVAQHVDLPERLQRLVRRRAHAVAVGDVGLDEVHRVVARKLLLRPGDMLVAPVGEADLHPLFEKRARHAEADAAGPAGDEGVLAGQMFHACSSRARPWARPYSMKMGAITTLRRPLRAFRSPCAGAAV